MKLNLKWLNINLLKSKPNSKISKINMLRTIDEHIIFILKL